MTNFALTGCAGYIAPRHLKAIQDVGGRLVAALDPCDSVGILDSCGYDVRYFTDFERFERHLLHLRGTNDQVDYVSVCSPNYLHEAHARAALRAGASAIVEKPMVINPDNLDLLEECESRLSKTQRVWAIMQMRYHPEILRLRAKAESEPNKIHRVDMTYVTARGPWYQRSWKGDQEKSGGLLMNIGVHLFDLLVWIFGEPLNYWHNTSAHTANGEIKLEHAQVSWLLSISPGNAAQNPAQQRNITVDGELYDFTQYGGELHTLAYREILAGRGFGIADAKPALEFVHKLSQTHLDMTGG
jgi:UDP-N-acetyl-2-amino-2-deoxyglucuronate dehydrogenase